MCFIYNFNAILMKVYCSTKLSSKHLNSFRKHTQIKADVYQERTGRPKCILKLSLFKKHWLLLLRGRYNPTNKELDNIRRLKVMSIKRQQEAQNA